MITHPLLHRTRRHFFQDCGIGVGKIALASLLACSLLGKPIRLWVLAHSDRVGRHLNKLAVIQHIAGQLAFGPERRDKADDDD